MQNCLCLLRRHLPPLSFLDTSKTPLPPSSASPPEGEKTLFSHKALLRPKIFPPFGGNQKGVHELCRIALCLLRRHLPPLSFLDTSKTPLPPSSASPPVVLSGHFEDPSASFVGISPRCPFWTLRRPLCLLRRHLPRRGRRPIASTKHCYVRRFFPPLGGIKRGCMNQAEMLFAFFVGISPRGGEGPLLPTKLSYIRRFFPPLGGIKGGA